ncbi:MAG: peptidoglycan DD-metalloendopeptidase family protein, partial [Patescibacteria group bacterium]
MKTSKFISLAFVLMILLAPSVYAAVEREGLFDRASKTVDALIFIRNELDKKYETFVNSAGQTDQIALDKLPLLEAKANTLSAQLSNLDENLKREQINLDDLQQKTKAVQLELADLSELSEMREVEMARSQDLLNEFIRTAYAETMQYTDWQTGEISTLKFLFTDESLADIETQKTYLDVLQNVSAGLILDLQNKQKDFEKAQANLLAKRGELIILQQEIITRARGLEEMRAAKQDLLNQTLGEESRYRKLVEESQRQEVEARSAIAELQSQLGAIDSQLKIYKSNLSEDEFARLLKDQEVAATAGVIFPNRVPRVIWPASPTRGVTAYFHDSSYQGRFGVQHQALDFRLPQGSRVNAAAPGIIYKAKDNGKGYSFIAIAHPGGLATVYGHISRILVKEGDLVRAGDLIGLSGGIPGTPGAGYMTTGAHL